MTENEWYGCIWLSVGLIIGFAGLVIGLTNLAYRRSKSLVEAIKERQLILETNVLECPGLGEIPVAVEMVVCPNCKCAHGTLDMTTQLTKLPAPPCLLRLGSQELADYLNELLQIDRNGVQALSSTFTRFTKAGINFIGRDCPELKKADGQVLCFLGVINGFLTRSGLPAIEEACEYTFTNEGSDSYVQHYRVEPK